MHTECLTPQARKILKTMNAIVRDNRFVLAGGSAAVLHLGHRRSVDFDFFSEKSFSTERILQNLKKLGLSLTILQEGKGTLTMSASGIKTLFFHYPYPFGEAMADFLGVPVAGLVDIAAMKILAVAQRGAKRDFVDLYFILQDIPFAKIAENMIQRFGADRVSPVVAGKAMVYFNDAEADPEPEYLVRKKDWKTIKKFFIDHVQQFTLDLHKARQ